MNSFQMITFEVVALKKHQKLSGACEMCHPRLS